MLYIHIEGTKMILLYIIMGLVIADLFTTVYLYILTQRELFEMNLRIKRVKNIWQKNK